ncbi:succinylglutamate desuccinylase [Edaphovirga cremea]|uniref:succinylglutamate desuccinylase n=1 Tax=Edaphovirga cremea TaxID=2267246 RepID=UPI0039894B42
MFDFLSLTLGGTPPAEPHGQIAHLEWQWLDDGVLELSPRRPCERAVVLSAGIHGNETAPIEILNRLVSELLSEGSVLAVRLLVILGNPPAMRTNTRYLHSDMNRMFGGRHALFIASGETERAWHLEQHMAAFFQRATAAGATSRFHFDLHTAIRGSHYLRFGLLPSLPESRTPSMLAWLESAGLEALVFHQSPGGTFTHFSGEVFHAASCTLELGKALPFGSNDLSQFLAAEQALRALISGGTLPERSLPAIKRFRVVRDLIKHHNDFRLNVAEDALNFTSFGYGDLLAEESGQRYVVEHEREWLLFPNAKVANGLRAGLMLVEESDREARGLIGC